MAQSKKSSKRVVSDPKIVVAEIPTGRTLSFDVEFDADQRAAIQSQLELMGLAKLRLKGSLTPQGRSDWVLEATLGASAAQACVVTLEPVKTRVDDTVHRVFEANWVEPEDETAEMDENVESEALGDVIDLSLIASEALSLALPDYPRSAEAELEETTFTEPGVKPMSDEDTKPFAALAALKEKMEK